MLDEHLYQFELCGKPDKGLESSYIEGVLPGLQPLSGTFTFNKTVPGKRIPRPSWPSGKSKIVCKNTGRALSPQVFVGSIPVVELSFFFFSFSSRVYVLSSRLTCPSRATDTCLERSPKLPTIAFR